MASDMSDEIRQLEQDLENLERRYSMLGRLAIANRILWFSFFWIVVGIGFAISGYGVWIADSKAAIIPLVVLFLVAVYLWIARTDKRWGRWIDYAGWSPPGSYGFKFIGLPEWDSVKRSEAEAIEDMIEERKARLARLRGKKF